MTNILDTIVQHKRTEVAARSQRISERELMQTSGFSRTCVSLAEHLRNPETSGIITEFKRRSPSKGAIHEDADVGEVTSGYARYGASGLSVLTDEHFFGGSTSDLETARAANQIPILRKDFIVTPYQVIETKSLGADVLLLISECLTHQEVASLSALARDLGLEVLLEMHSEAQLHKIGPGISLVGINNRDLKTFQVDIERSIRLAERLPASLPRIAESGIDHPETIVRMREAGFDGFLMGEYFMKQPRPEEAFRQFLEKLPPRTAQQKKHNTPKLKVCGIARDGDMRQAAALGASYAGMIFYGPSPRFADGRLAPEEVREIKDITKVGVFVNASVDYILETHEKYGLDMAQLHGDESPEDCRKVRTHLPVIKAFRMSRPEDLERLKAYENNCDYFLFDTPGALYGGNGSGFDWRILNAYRGPVPFFLSGGIGPESVPALKAFSHPLLYGIDINSCFETRPGEKNMEDIKRFIWDLNII